jgi:hypothetical protein
MNAFRDVGRTGNRPSLMARGERCHDFPEALASFAQEFHHESTKDENTKKARAFLSCFRLSCFRD